MDNLEDETIVIRNYEEAKDKITEIAKELVRLRRELKEATTAANVHKGERDEIKRWYDEFIQKITKYVPENYDGDEAAEAIVLKWAKDVSKHYHPKTMDKMAIPLIGDTTIIEVANYDNHMIITYETDSNSTFYQLAIGQDR